MASYSNLQNGVLDTSPGQGNPSRGDVCPPSFGGNCSVSYIDDLMGERECIKREIDPVKKFKYPKIGRKKTTEDIPWKYDFEGYFNPVKFQGVAEPVTPPYKLAKSPAQAFSIKKIPEFERPREKLEEHGGEVLSTAELIAIIIGTGIKTKGVLELAQEIVAHFGTLKNIAEATLQELRQIEGMGKAKAIQLKAACALGFKLSKQSIPIKYRIDHPDHAYYLVRDQLEREKRELFAVILQDVRHYVITQHLISIGTLTNTLVHPREVFYPAIRHKAASIILAHNHPSGDPHPSTDDFNLTVQLINIGKLLEIPIVDHLIIGEGSYVSLRQRGIAFY